MDTPRPSPRTNRTRRVPHPVPIGHAASLSQVTDLHERAARAEKHEMAQRRRAELAEAQLAETQALLRASEERANGLSEQVSSGELSQIILFSSMLHHAPLAVWSLLVH